MELEAGLLSFVLAAEGYVTELSMWVGLSYCDGDWKPLSLAKRGSLISAAVNDWAEETRGEAVRLRVDSPLYLGGVPMELTHPALDSRSHKHGENNISAFTLSTLLYSLTGCTSHRQWSLTSKKKIYIFCGDKQ